MNRQTMAGRGRGRTWQGLQDLFVRPAPQRRRIWTFETLEARHFLSATPIEGPLPPGTYSFSSDTPEGLATILQRELDWAFKEFATISRASGEYATATQWVVRAAPGTSVDEIAQQTGLTVNRPYGDIPDTYFMSSSGIDPLQIDAGLGALGNVTAYFPASFGTNPAPTSLPTDELFADQWHLLNTEQVVGPENFQEIRGLAGEDINVTPVWQELGVTGEGVVVAIVDTGVQLKHPDLVDNIHPTLRQNLLGGGSNANPGGSTGGDAHGTAVAGLVAAGNNGFGTVGVAYDAQIAPVRRILGDFSDPSQIVSLFVSPAEFEYLTFAYENQQIDIYNHSWGPGDGVREVNGMSPLGLLGLRDSVFRGRGGLGNIHVFAAGNDAAAENSFGFLSLGFLDSARFNGFTNSRYTIGVTGVDHDGRRISDDGTITTYPESGPSILVAAPTGSFPIEIGGELIGSGLWTTDLTGDAGINQEPLDSGLEIDFDFLDDVDYTSRMNGTSASAPLVSGVIALMLDANPNLSYRDVQEILVRTARQNGLDETVPDTVLNFFGAGAFQSDHFWRTNNFAIFRDPAAVGFEIYVDEEGMPFDPWFEIFGPGPQPVVVDELFLRGTIDDEGNLVPPRIPLPDALYTNGAGYTVSDGRGLFGEEAGYGHGVVDAELAVRMAQQWHTKRQNLPPELTFTTFVALDDFHFFNLPAAEAGGDEIFNMRIPGGLGGLDGFVDFFNEFGADFPDEPDEGDELPDPREGGAFPPATPQDWPDNSRGFPVQLTVPESNLMAVEWVEVKVDITGDPEALDFLRLTLVSPDGTHSELNQHNLGGFLQGTYSIQDGVEGRGNFLFDTDPPGAIGATDQFTWTFSTNRHWGERSDGITTASDVQQSIDSPTVLRSNFYSPVDGTWELVFENWSDTEFMVENYEVTWHGQRITPGSQRIQGFVGADTNQDGTFIYNMGALGGEPHAANVTVELIGDIVDGNGNVVPIVLEQFVVGADGNFYFDVLPGDYTVRVRDDLGAPLTMLTDEVDGIFQDEWQISADDFLYQPVDAEGNPLVDLEGNPIIFPVDIAGVNFLVDPGPPPPSLFSVEGSVFADIDGDGHRDAADPPVGNAIVFVDSNLTGQFEAGGDQFVFTDIDGNYSMEIPSDAARRFKLGVVPPNLDWKFSNPDTGIHEIFAQPGETITTGTDFFIQPPSVPSDFPVSPTAPGSVLGFVFGDSNQNGNADLGETGLGGITVFLDLDANGALNRDANGVPTEPFTTTFDSGSFFFSNVGPGTYRVDVEEPFPLVTSFPQPPNDFVTITLEPQGTVTNVVFGLFNPATRDFGDLPAPFPTLLLTDDDGNVLVDGPRHDVVEGFNLGPIVDAELNGQPTDVAEFPEGDNTIGMDEDGVVLLDPLGQPGGSLREGTNTLQIEINGVGGYLHAWMDLNGNEQFDANEKIIAGDQLNPGFHFYDVNIPIGQLPTGPVAARFRWSELESLSFTGNGLRGEVEDYLFATVAAAQQVVSPDLRGDYNSDSVVDGADYDVWKSQLGQTVAAGTGADGNSDGTVNLADYSIWRDNLGQVAASSASNLGSNYNVRFARRAYADAAYIAGSMTPLQVNISPEFAAELEAASGASANTAGNGASAVAPTSVRRTGSMLTDAVGDVAAEQSAVAPTIPAGSDFQFESIVLEGLGNVPAGPFVVASSNVELNRPIASLRTVLFDRVFQERDESAAGGLDDNDVPLGNGQQDDEEIETALVVALSEEVDWRLP